MAHGSRCRKPPATARNQRFFGQAAFAPVTMRRRACRPLRPVPTSAAMRNKVKTPLAIHSIVRHSVSPYAGVAA
jgi:hypothetical protein